MSRYSMHVQLPFSVDLQHLIPTDEDTTKLLHLKRQPSIFPAELTSWLLSLGIIIEHAEIFHTPPRDGIVFHVDGAIESDIVKLNWCYGAEGSMMLWAKQKDPLIPMKQVSTVIGTNYLYLDIENARVVHSTKIRQPTLVNVGRPHNVINRTGESRWVISAVLGDAETNKHLVWDDAVKRLSGQV